MGIKPSLEGHSVALPKDAIGVISTLFNHKLPAYDVDEKSPEASVEHSEDVIRFAQNFDKEQFPKDLPEDLIRELLSLKKGEQ